MQNPIVNELPSTFDPNQYETIPWGAQTLFEGSNPELESLGKELIRKSLEKRLGKPVISRAVLNERFGLRKLGFTSDHISTGKVLVR